MLFYFCFLVSQGIVSTAHEEIESVMDIQWHPRIDFGDPNDIA
jgi:hypothetical protein